MTSLFGKSRSTLESSVL